MVQGIRIAASSPHCSPSATTTSTRQSFQQLRRHTDKNHYQWCFFDPKGRFLLGHTVTTRTRTIHRDQFRQTMKNNCARFTTKMYGFINLILSTINTWYFWYFRNVESKMLMYRAQLSQYVVTGYVFETTSCTTDVQSKFDLKLN